MLLFNAHKSSQGFTLAETAVITVIAGILAALAAPGLIGWYNKTKVDDALTQVQGALQEAQREAIRRGRSDCTVTIPSGSDQTIIGTCLLSNRQLNDVNIRRTNTISTITFNFRGGTANTGTIVLSASSTSTQKCLTLAPGIGLIRSGDYSSADTAGTTAGNCTTLQQR